LILIVGHIFYFIKRAFVQENKITILMYHKIVPYLNEPVAVCEDSFHKQIEFLKNNMNVIDLQDLEDILYNQAEINPKSIMITFDDGYKNNLEYAYPILKDAGLKAIIFVPTGLMGRKYLPHDISYISLEKTLNWNELRAMQDVFEVGAHAVTHRVLTEMPFNEAVDEIRNSRKQIEDRLGNKVTAFAYPKGSIGDFNRDLELAVQSAGYKFCFTTLAGLDALILTSLNEGLPVAIIEAMAAGLPILSTQVGGVNELLNTNPAGRAGRMTIANDSVALSKDLINFLEELPELTPLANSIRQDIQRKYSVERLANDMQLLYSELLPT